MPGVNALAPNVLKGGEMYFFEPSPARSAAMAQVSAASHSVPGSHSHRDSPVCGLYPEHFARRSQASYDNADPQARYRHASPVRLAFPRILAAETVKLAMSICLSSMGLLLFSEHRTGPAEGGVGGKDRIGRPVGCQTGRSAGPQARRPVRLLRQNSIEQGHVGVRPHQLIVFKNAQRLARTGHDIDTRTDLADGLARIRRNTLTSRSSSRRRYSKTRNRAPLASSTRTKAVYFILAPDSWRFGSVKVSVSNCPGSIPAAGRT